MTVMWEPLQGFEQNGDLIPPTSEDQSGFGVEN